MRPVLLPKVPDVLFCLGVQLMFAYISVNLGGSGAGVAKAVGRGLFLAGRAVFRLFHVTSGRARSNSVRSFTSTSGIANYLKRQVFVDSKVLLGESPTCWVTWATRVADTGCSLQDCGAS